ncbi:MAG TPA: DNA-binding domain-containing protein, partial [Tepidisphaeraceae bacterium]|nr:DNA-binding domain-containing protein [Tepidisphaeraceae bacterium]
MPSSPPKAPKKLKDIQRLAAAAIRLPLNRDNRMQSNFTDGRPMKQLAQSFIKPNDRLTSLERLEIYNRQYWFRVLDCLYDDYPGLRAILGQEKFHRISRTYLEQYPSRSFTLRNLGSRLEQFLIDNP